MDDERNRIRRVGSVLLGGLIGASAVVAAARRRARRRPKRTTSAGLAAFEEAPCYHEAVERERAEQERASSA